MKVYLSDNGASRLIGRADVPDDGAPVFEVRLFGAASIIADTFTVGTVTHLPASGSGPVIERVILVSEVQRPEILPGWQPLSS
jgi:hypothetical protein